MLMVCRWHHSDGPNLLGELIHAIARNGRSFDCESASPVTEGFHRLVRALGVNGPPPRGEILLPVGSARLRINLSEAEGGRPGKLLLECAVAREAIQQDQALRACMLRNMSTALTRWVYLNQRRTIVLRASIPVPSHRDLAWSVPLAATAATLMAREAATEGAAVAQDAGGLSSTPYDPTGTLPELATMLATAPWEPSPNTLRTYSEGLRSRFLCHESPHGLLAGVSFPQFSQSKDTTLSGLVVTLRRRHFAVGGSCHPPSWLAPAFWW